MAASQREVHLQRRQAVLGIGEQCRAFEFGHATGREDLGLLRGVDRRQHGTDRVARAVLERGARVALSQLQREQSGQDLAADQAVVPLPDHGGLGVGVHQVGRAAEEALGQRGRQGHRVARGEAQLAQRLGGHTAPDRVFVALRHPGQRGGGALVADRAQHGRGVAACHLVVGVQCRHQRQHGRAAEARQGLHRVHAVVGAGHVGHRTDQRRHGPTAVARAQLEHRLLALQLVAVEHARNHFARVARIVGDLAAPDRRQPHQPLGQGAHFAPTDQHLGDQPAVHAVEHPEGLFVPGVVRQHLLEGLARARHVTGAEGVHGVVEVGLGGDRPAEHQGAQKGGEWTVSGRRHGVLRGVGGSRSVGVRGRIYQGWPGG